MHISLIIDDMHPRSGGPPRVVAGSAIALAERGHDVSIVSLVAAGDEAAVRESLGEALASGVLFYPVPVPGPGQVAALVASDPVTRAVIEQSDIVHVHGVWSPYLVKSGQTAWRAGVPYFVSSHGVFDHRAMTRVRHKWLKKRVAFELLGIRAFLDRAAGVVFGTRAEAQESWIGSRKVKLTYVPNGAPSDLGTASPTEEERASWQQALPKIAGKRPLILCRSRLHPEKGVDLLVRAFGEIAAEFPTAALAITGLRQDTVYQKSLDDLIESGGARDRIALTTELTGTGSLFVYAMADIVAMPSLAEGFSVAMVEGLAHGKPMLITRYCHLPLLQEAGAGLVVEPAVRELAEGLGALLSLGPAGRRHMGLRARALFDEHYTWTRVAERLEDIYGQARNGRADSGR